MRWKVKVCHLHVLLFLWFLEHQEKGIILLTCVKMEENRKCVREKERERQRACERKRERWGWGRMIEIGGA